MMRSTFNLQRLLVLQRAQQGEQNLPPLLTCRDVLEFATIEGARCANLDSKVGTLDARQGGRHRHAASADRLDVWPLNNAPRAVVNLMNPSHVDTVFIAGKVKKWRGNLVGRRCRPRAATGAGSPRRCRAPSRVSDEPARLKRRVDADAGSISSSTPCGQARGGARLPPITVAIGNSRCRPVRLPS